MSLCLFCFSSYQFLFHIFCYFLRKDIKKYPLAQIIPLGARRICNPPLKNVLTFLGISDLQSATFSLCFLRCCWGITNPPVLIGRTFFLRRISNPPGRLAEDFLLTPGGGLSSVRRSAAIIHYIPYLQYSDKKTKFTRLWTTTL